ncbi:MAG: hypothetical protein ABI693_34445, partial [Bryobacteraceae bacterium]
MTFSAHLGTLNSNRGSVILGAGNYLSFQRELAGLKALGVKGVVANIDYPILDSGFDAYGGQAADYLALYRSAAVDIRAAGLKLIVETGGIFSDPVFSPLNVTPFYDSLSLTQYMNGRATQAALIATQLQPDYLNVLQEPDTEALQSGKAEVYTLTGSVNLLNSILTQVKATGTNIPIGAGVGAWLPTDPTGKGVNDYVNAYAAIPSLDSIDIHIYPVNRDFLQRMNTIASIAKSKSKKLTISEAWAYKQRDSELNKPAFPASVLYARDVFSFWSPLDVQFLEAVVNWCYYQHVEYMAAFWSQYFRAYLTYDSSTQSQSPSVLNALAQTAAGIAISLPAVTPTATAWNVDIMNPVDTTAPTAPAVTATEYPNQIVLNWTSTDDTGVYEYTVMRDGVATVTTIEGSFSELGLLDGKCYVYTVTSLDFAGHATPTATPPFCTPDITPPTAPTTTTATAGPVAPGPPSTSSMRVAWFGATDNTGPTGIDAYAIYRSVGSSTGPFVYLAQVPASQLNYTDAGIQQSDTLYCYKIKTLDLVGLPSP